MSQVEAFGITVDLPAKRAALEEIERLLPFFQIPEKFVDKATWQDPRSLPATPASGPATSSGQ